MEHDSPTQIAYNCFVQETAITLIETAGGKEREIIPSWQGLNTAILGETVGSLMAATAHAMSD